MLFIFVYFLIKNKKVLEALYEAGVNTVMPAEEKASDSLAGLTFVITGTLPSMGRKEAQELIKQNALSLLEKVEVKGISHITGGGFYENIPRSIPEGFGAKIDKSKVRILPIFDLIAKVGGISEHDMFNTFNMGVGMSIVVAASDADRALEVLKENGEDAYIIGEIVKSDEKVIL